MEFGVNVDPGHWPNDPHIATQLLVKTGANWTRTVLKLDNASLVQTYFEGCIANGVKELGVIARESAGFSEHPGEAELEDKISQLYDTYIDLVDIWQIGNQPDNPAEDSWTQDEDTTALMLDVADRIIPGNKGQLCAPALVTGKPYNIEDYSITHRAANIYSKAKDYNSPGYPYVGSIEATTQLVTEYPANDNVLARKIITVGNIDTMFVFCLSDKMYNGLGLFNLQDKPNNRFKNFKFLVDKYQE